MGHLKLMVGIVVVIFAFTSTAIIVAVLNQNYPTLRTVPPLERSFGKSTVSACVGYGWSTSRDPQEAVQEAVARMMEVLGENGPEFIFLFCSSKYEEAILWEVNRQFPDAKVYGGTSFLGVLTPAGLHTSENGSLVMMGVRSTKITFGVGHASFDELPPENAGEVAVRRAMEDAGIEGMAPKLVLVTMAPGREEDVLRGIARVVGENVPVFGGSSADEGTGGRWKQFANDRVMSNGVSVAVFFTDLCLCYSYGIPYEVVERKGKITRAQGRIIYEIDGQPAAEVYNSWVGEFIGGELGPDGTVQLRAIYWPLAKVVGNPLVGMFHVPMLPSRIENGAIEVRAEVENGMYITLLRGAWELLLNQPFKIANKAVEKCRGGEISFAIFFCCAGNIRGIPEGERSKIPLLLTQVLGDTPFIGTFTFGGQIFLNGMGNVHANLVNWIVIFSEEGS